jgi:uncharacterized protein
MTILDRLLADVPERWRVKDVFIGINWTLAQVESADGEQRAGVASTPRQIAPDTPYPPGHYRLDSDVRQITELLLSHDASAAAVGLATLNALQQPISSALTTADAADWLATQSQDRTVAFFGRFPFIDAEIRPFAKQIFVFEQNPNAVEYDSTQMAQLLPQADMVAVTGSSVINHTIDAILNCVSATSTVILLGPSTPLSEKLLDYRIDGLFGVRVADVPAAIESLMAGATFQHMHGLQRVALFKPDLR